MTLISLFVAAAFGCNERVGGGPHESNLRLIAVLYSQYMAAHDGQAPQNTEDFRAYVQSLGPGVLQRTECPGWTSCLLPRATVSRLRLSARPETGIWMARSPTSRSALEELAL